jgi:hypothetical protein
MNVSALIFAASMSAVLFLSARSSKRLLLCYVFFVPWIGLQSNIGLTLSIDRMIAVIILLVILGRVGLDALVGFGVFLLYVFGDTVVQSIELPGSAKDYPPLQGEYRWLFQLVIWGLYLAPAMYAARLANAELVTRAYRVLLGSVAVLSMLAIVQFVVFYATGVDLFPIGILGPSGEMHAGMFDSASFMGGRVFRPCALGGEPKHLAYSIALALTVLLADAMWRGPLGLSSRRRMGLAALFVAALVLAFSTQGFALVVANVVIVVGVTLWTRPRGKFRMMKPFIAIAAILAAGAFIPGLRDVVADRTVGRVSESGAIEDFNLAVWAWLREHPAKAILGVGLGNVHLYAAPFVPMEVRHYMLDGVFVAKSGLLRLISELGIVGCGLFLYALIGPLARLVRRDRSSVGRLTPMHVAFASCVLLDYCMSADGPMYVFLTAGLTLALVRTCRARQEDGLRRFAEPARA